jgi:4-hydroxy-3-methylbut-2-enyl diphosphate reductase
MVIVIGAPNSSNSLRLVEVASRSGCPRALMVQRARELDLATLAGVSVLGLTAGASAPETLVDELIDHLRTRFSVTVEEVRVAEEDVVFRLPSALATA